MLKIGLTNLFWCRNMDKRNVAPLTKSAYMLLKLLRSKAVSEYVYRVNIKQSELAGELNISRQALSVKLKPLIERGYLRTGRGFIEITEKGLMALGQYSKPAFILVSVEPEMREEVYRQISERKIGRVNRVAGDIDLIIEVEGSKATDVLDYLSNLRGVTKTKTYFTLQAIS